MATNAKAKKPTAKAKSTSTKKTSNKTTSAKTPETPKTTAKTTTKTTTTKPAASPAKKSNKNNLWKIILGILGALLIVGLATWGIVSLINSSKVDPAMVVETGKGEKIETGFITVDDANFRIKVPTRFKKLDADQLKEDYGEDAPNVAYTDINDNEVAITISLTGETFKNDQIKDYLDTMKTVLGVGGATVHGTDYYTVENHNVGTIDLTLKSGNESVFSRMMFFTDNDKLVIVTFNCEDKLKDEWKNVGDFIFKSLEFKK